ncbi:MAG TPA: hypothetical protein VLT61_03540 [Anaeromyxobacteraceae bacterium]|nr:hypothetical protein [Anaeromyxobacteraceae bacterium]
MIVCPVCEHPQQSGAECEVCGKRFAAGSLPVPPVPPMEGLETTEYAPVDLGFDAGGTLPELEATLAPPVDAPEERIPGVEPTRAAPVDVDAPPMADVERIQAELPGDGLTPLPLAPTCRYCRTPAVPGERLCSRCGMRLPVIDAALTSRTADGVQQCSNCGAMTSRELCPACGNRLSSAPLE